MSVGLACVGRGCCGTFFNLGVAISSRGECSLPFFEPRFILVPKGVASTMPGAAPLPTSLSRSLTSFSFSAIALARSSSLAASTSGNGASIQLQDQVLRFSLHPDSQDQVLGFFLHLVRLLSRGDCSLPIFELRFILVPKGLLQQCQGQHLRQLLCRGP